MRILNLSKNEEKNALELLYINLSILYLLNIIDLIFTKVLLYLAPDLFAEANVFMIPVVDGMGIYFLKIVVFAAVLLYWGIRSKYSSEKQLKRSSEVCSICTKCYLAIVALHVINTVLYFIFN